MSREFDEPVPTEHGEIYGEVIEEDGEEEIVGGQVQQDINSPNDKTQS